MIIDDWGESERGVHTEEVRGVHTCASVEAAREKRGQTKKKERLLKVYGDLTELQNRTSGFLTLINVPKKVIICTCLVA